jgi:hypothetical protein
MRYIDLVKGTEIDIDKRENISAIKRIRSDDDKFYVVCNVKDGKTGLFLFSLEHGDIDSPPDYFIKQQTNCKISNASIECIKKQNNIVVSYTTIGKESYNVLVFDLETRLNLFNFEFFMLSEDHCLGFLLATNDFLILTQSGIHMINLSTKKGRDVKDFEGQTRFLHSLGASDFLKIEKTNNILFDMCNYDDRKLIVQE